MTSDAARFICIHGHFYQPPRENPWIESIELQESAKPYHDWNERINVECYAPNARARVLDEAGRLTHVNNNYAWISFNFGPTLLSWMESKDPDTYALILEADRESLQRWGHGNAIAQVYNHMIMPLACQRDRETQVRWGVADFRRRFRREPEGIWLPECGCDYATLQTVADAGLRFVILEPGQAARIRPFGGRWSDTHTHGLDPSRPYRCFMPARGGKRDRTRYVDIFFYDGPISRAVSFEDLLRNGERFAQRLAGAWVAAREHAQLIHIATDGESYGHHKMFGEMALAYVIQRGMASRGFQLTNYAAFLDREPPVWEVELNEGEAGEGTSWSCIHGVARWKRDCGCHTGGEPGWNQQWRTPLREAFDLLRDELAVVYEQQSAGLFTDPWDARNRYIDIILDRTPENLEAFLRSTTGREVLAEERRVAVSLLEMQRHAMLMYTSCGWFFSDLEGIETVQDLAYAARATQLARHLTGNDAIGAAMEARLRDAVANRHPFRTAKDLFASVMVQPDRVFRKVVNQYAVMSLFHEDPLENARLFHYSIHAHEMEQFRVDERILVIGRVTVESGIIPASGEFRLVLLFSGGFFQTWIRSVKNLSWTDDCASRIREAFQTDKDGCVALITEICGDLYWTLRDLYRDERLYVLRRLLQHQITGWHSTYTQLFESTRDIVKSARDAGLEIPEEFKFIATRALERKFRTLVDNPSGTWPLARYDDILHDILRDIAAFDLDRNAVMPAEVLSRLMAGRLHSALEDRDTAGVERLILLLRLLQEQQVGFDTAAAQVRFFRYMKESAGALRQTAAGWVQTLQELATILNVRWDAVYPA